MEVWRRFFTDLRHVFDLPGRADSKVAQHLLDRRGRPSSKEGKTKVLFGCGLAAISLSVSFLFAAGDRIICAFGPNTSSYNAYSDQRPSSDAMQLASPVNAAMAGACSPKCPRISLFRNTTAANAMLIASADQMKIVYKPEFFTTIYDTYGEAGIQAIFAHELGHAIDATTSAPWIKLDWTPVLRSDAWTGCALERLNLNARGLRAALEVLSKYPATSHPDWNARLQVMRVGYIQCGGDGSKL